VITERDLQEAIMECQGERNPNAQTCIKLAAYYTILNQISEKPIERPIEQMPLQEASYTSKSEFFQLIENKTFDEVLALFDEVMEALAVYNPRLYDSIMRKI
jgi:hypothetical protein